MATHIKTLIESFFKNTQHNQVLYQEIDTIMAGILDEETKKHISLKDITTDSVIFSARSSSAVYNFNLQKGKILKAIKKNTSRIEQVHIKVQ